MKQGKPVVTALATLRELSQSLRPPAEWGETLTIIEFAETVGLSISGSDHFLRRALDGKIRKMQVLENGRSTWRFCAADAIEAYRGYVSKRKGGGKGGAK